ncbi:MAG: dehydrogenase [Herminiimonas sp.]|nr:dehydrogenase [Herminiimonas sp.]
MRAIVTLPNILVLYAHPAAHLSRVNSRMVDAARGMPNVTVHDLYETYPDFDIDVPREQALIAAADLVVFQHPVQWFGMPALMKEWVDVVLEHGWAFGEGGTALHGKDHLLAITSGGPQDSYRPDGSPDDSFSAFLPPFQQTAELCGMRWNAPLVFHGARHADLDAVSLHVEVYRQHLADYPAWARPK